MKNKIYQFMKFSSPKLHLLFFIFTFKATAQVIPAYIPQQGLKAWYPFNGNTNDESGNNNAINYGATLTTDRFSLANSAFHFDGISQYIDLTKAFDFKFRTINLWMSADSIDALQRHIYVSDNSSLNYGFTQVRAEIMNGNNVAITNACDGLGFGQHAISKNIWYMLTLVIGPEGVLHYFNGTLYHTSTIANLTSNIGHPTALLATSRVFNRFFNGKIDDVGIWDRELTKDEIEALYNASQTSVSAFDKSEEFDLKINTKTNEIILNSTIKNLGSNYSIINSMGQLIESNKLMNSITVISTVNYTKGVYFFRTKQNKAIPFIVE